MELRFAWTKLHQRRVNFGLAGWLNTKDYAPGGSVPKIATARNQKNKVTRLLFPFNWATNQGGDTGPFWGLHSLTYLSPSGTTLPKVPMQSFLMYQYRRCFFFILEAVPLQSLNLIKCSARELPCGS
eukprot:452636-Pelagomonas_calceolata.AAC.1